MKPVLIIRGDASRIDEFKDIKSEFESYYAASPEEYDGLIDRLSERAEAVITNGSIGLKTHQMEKLGKLRIVLCRGAGIENVDIEQARARGITVTNGAGVNWFTVADQAMTLLLGIVRDSVDMDRGCRADDWTVTRAIFRPTLHRKRIGIVGMGQIGKGIARRAAGFEMEIFYTARSPKAEVEGTYVEDLKDLATRVDFLVLSLPGGAETRHIVDADILEALGPTGYLVNVARGSVVDTAALIDALHTGRIAGAGLDVWEGEPDVPDALKTAPRTLLSPHVGGFSPEAVDRSNRMITENIRAFFSGRHTEIRNRI